MVFLAFSFTATCSAEGCTPNDSEGHHTATLTIAAPAGLTYDGSEKAAVITDATAQGRFTKRPAAEPGARERARAKAKPDRVLPGRS